MMQIFFANRKLACGNAPTIAAGRNAPAPAPIFSVTVTERAQNAAPQMVLILLAASSGEIRPI
jgi:hypothetical protein